MTHMSGLVPQLAKSILVGYKQSWLAGALITMVISTAVPNFATADQGDVTATKTYLGALYELVHTEEKELLASKINANELIHSVSHGCSRVVTNVHHTKQTILLSLEVGGALTVVMTRPDRAQIESFVRTVSVLRWNDRRVEDRVRAYVHKLIAEIHVTHVPNLCADVTAWVQSGFQEDDAHTVQFVKTLQTAEAGPENVPNRLLRKYERPGEHELLRGLAKVDQYLESHALNLLLTAWYRLLKVIGLQ
jgi:hypothetical protein